MITPLYSAGGESLQIEPDGKIAATGRILNFNNHNVFGLLRYKQNAAIDSAFRVNGKVITDFGGAGGIQLRYNRMEIF